MKVMLHQGSDGELMIYVPKKDLEEPVVARRQEGAETIFLLGNGWEFSISELPNPLSLPKTLEARRVGA